MEALDWALESHRRADIPCAAAATFRPEFEVAGHLTRVRIEQLRAVDLHRLDELVGRLRANEQRVVDEALELGLGLYTG